MSFLMKTTKYLNFTFLQQLWYETRHGNDSKPVSFSLMTIKRTVSPNFNGHCKIDRTECTHV